jgi:hypothetical protein
MDPKTDLFFFWKPTATMFEAEAEHSTRGQIKVQGPGGGSSRSQSLNGTVKFFFRAEQGDCAGASGELQSETLDAMEKQMRGAGFSVAREGFKWSMTRMDDVSDPIRQLKDELAKKGPGGDGAAAARTAEADRLAKIADRFKAETPDLVDCLMPFWRDHATKVYWGWVDQDVGSLRAYQGDFSGLNALALQGMVATRAIVTLGVDSCATAAQERLWAALEAAYEGCLLRMIKAKAPAVRLAEVIERSELLGVVSPALRERCIAALWKAALTEAKATYEALLAAFAAANQQFQAPTVQAALLTAMAAEQMALMMDINRNQVAVWLEKQSGATGQSPEP